MNQNQKKKEVDLVEYWRIVLKRKWVIISFAGVLFFFTAVFTFLATPMYKSTATVMIEEETSRMLSIEDTFGYQTPVSRDLRGFNTQLKLLKSKSLAERVVSKADLLSREDFIQANQPRRGLLGAVKHIITFSWLKSKKNENEEESNPLYPSNPSSALARIIQNRLEVKHIRDTKLVELSYKSPSPALSAEIVNTVAREFKNFSVDMRLLTTQQASDFLSGQMAELSQELSEKNIELQRYSKEKDIFLLNPTESTAINELSQVNRAYTEARLETIEKQTIVQELRDMDANTIPQFVDNPAIQQMKANYINAKKDFEDVQREYLSSHPRFIQAKSRMESLEADLMNAVDTAESEYRAALQKEYRIKAELERQKETVVRTDSNALQYRLLKDEVEQKTKLLNSIMEKQQAALVSAKLGGLDTTNINIIDKAEIPLKPVSPKKQLNLFLALFFGLLGGVGLCFVLEYIDNTVKGPEDVEKLVGLPSVGIIPYMPFGENHKQKKQIFATGYKSSYEQNNKDPYQTETEADQIELINHRYPKLSIAEDYRTVRTSILLSYGDTPPKTILVTSALPKEGKSATAANLAVAFSQLGERVLVVDSDLRRPRQHDIFETDKSVGLSAFLSGNLVIEQAIQKTHIDNIFIIPSGPIPPNPSELLNSKRMQLLMEEVKDEFDFVFFDSPPVLAVIDSLIVSSLADATMFVIKAGKTLNKPFVSAIEELNKANAKLLGVLFNELVLKKGDMHFMDFYQYYRHEYYGDED
ncbi:MAG: polysaccharide biosynthesis tyrosine autokinase [Candidatus Aminicenantes bacterium]|nr:MAG: polysaccharide biosynthesis tyrosine autokinase [Candidatus Aminicenantes bacterium]